MSALPPYFPPVNSQATNANFQNLSMARLIRFSEQVDEYKLTDFFSERLLDKKICFPIV